MVRGARKHYKDYISPTNEFINCYLKLKKKIIVVVECSAFLVTSDD